MVDYSKWDMLDSDDEDAKASTSAPARTMTDDRRAHHDQSMALIAGWAREADPRLSEEELGVLMEFVKTQHPGIHEHNIMRHQGITAFLEASEASGHTPSLHSLLSLGHLAKERAEAPEAEVAGQGGRVLIVVMHALNTLVACDREGGARQLYDTCLRQPEGEVAVRYRALEYATDTVQNPPPDPRDAPPPEQEGSRWQKFRRALLMQLAMALISAALLKFFLDPQLEDVAMDAVQQHAADQQGALEFPVESGNGMVSE